MCILHQDVEDTSGCAFYSFDDCLAQMQNKERVTGNSYLSIDVLINTLLELMNFLLQLNNLNQPNHFLHTFLLEFSKP
jgi:hypothetical protein